MAQKVKYWKYDPDLEARINVGKNRMMLVLPASPNVDAGHLRSQLEHILFDTARGDRFLALLADYGWAIVSVNELSAMKAGIPTESTAVVHKAAQVAQRLRRLRELVLAMDGAADAELLAALKDVRKELRKGGGL